MIENINWYPGHMKKTRELIQENLKLVDVVIEVIDARIPVSSRNPIIDEIVSGKKRIIALNKSDISDEKENKKWYEKHPIFIAVVAAVIAGVILKFSMWDKMIQVIEYIFGG